MQTSLFDYELPVEIIAQTPIEPRHASRLMVINRNQSTIEHARFFDLPKYLHKNDLLVLNRTRVFPARIFAKKETGGKVELLLLRDLGKCRWEILVGGKDIKKNSYLHVNENIFAIIEEELNGSRRIVRFSRNINPFLRDIGEIPLPPYIHEKLSNKERYQTVYSKTLGSAATPTAGLHFTKDLMRNIQSKGIRFGFITLHIGLDTFLPLKVNNIEDHEIHKEWCSLDEKLVQLVNKTRENNGRVIAIGTTCARALETATNLSRNIEPYTGMTDLYITPGYRFKVVDAMITNFHLPKSTILIMVSAFAGREKILSAYQIAIRQKYRFYSFGDSMFIV